MQLWSWLKVMKLMAAEGEGNGVVEKGAAMSAVEIRLRRAWRLEASACSSASGFQQPANWMVPVPSGW